METPSPTKAQSSTLGIGRHEVEGTNPYLAAGLAILVGVVVFAFIWRIRKTFGMTE
jgi:hypothetical protein